MGKKVSYKSITRIENAILEEKIDGSNFSFLLDVNGNLHFFSATEELNKNTCEKFWLEFIELIEKWKKPLLIIGAHYFAEVLGMTPTKYYDNYKIMSAEDKLFIFDIKGLSNRFYTRDFMEKICWNAGFQFVPLTTLDHISSQLNDDILREGVIFRYDEVSGSKDAFKLKYVENKKGKKQKIKLHIEMLK